MLCRRTNYTACRLFCGPEQHQHIDLLTAFMIDSITASLLSHEMRRKEKGEGMKESGKGAQR